MEILGSASDNGAGAVKTAGGRHELIAQTIRPVLDVTSFENQRGEIKRVVMQVSSLVALLDVVKAQGARWATGDPSAHVSAKVRPV